MTKGLLFSKRIYVSYGAAAVLFWLFLRNAEWRVLLDGFRSVMWVLLGAAILLRLASLVVSSLRWQILLAPVRSVPLGPIVTATMMGAAINTIVSTHAAELVRPYMLSKGQGLDFSTTFATVTVEWFLDLLGILTLFIPSMALVRDPSSGEHSHAGLSGLNGVIALLLLIAVSGLWALRFLPSRVGRLRSWVLNSGAFPERLRKRVTDQLQCFAVGLQILTRPTGLAAVAAYSLLGAFFTAISAWLALMAFGLPVSFFSGFLILGLISVAGMIPTPGAIGGFHTVCQLGLVALFTLDPARTVLPVIGLHAVLYAPAAAIGALCLLWTRREPLRNEA